MKDLMELRLNDNHDRVVQIRIPRGFVSEASVVRVFNPKRPQRDGGVRVSLLRSIHTRMERNELDDNDPLSLGPKTIARVIEWVDGINREVGHVSVSPW